MDRATACQEDPLQAKPHACAAERALRQAARAAVAHNWALVVWVVFCVVVVGCKEFGIENLHELSFDLVKGGSFRGVVVAAGFY